MSRRDEAVKKEFNEFMRGRNGITPTTSNVSRPGASYNSSRVTRPSDVILDRSEKDRVAKLEQDHEVLKGGFNKLREKYNVKVSALKAELDTARQECASLGHKVRVAEYQARTAKEDVETARNEIPQNVLAEIVDVVKCSICHELPVVPFSTDCRHVFCGACLVQTFRSNGNTCPDCRTICGNEPKRDFSLRGIIPLLCTLQGREEPTATSTNFNLGVFTQMYREERERRRLEDEMRRQEAAMYQVADVEMGNGGIEVEIISLDEDPNWGFADEVQEVPGDGGGDAEEIDEEL